MSTKRFAEYRMINDHKQASLYRKSFIHYTEKRLLISTFFYAMLAVMFLGIFLVKYHIEYIIAMPFICGLFCIYLDLAYQDDSAAQKPEKLFKEKWLMAYVVFLIVLFVLLSLIKIEALRVLLDVNLLVV